MDIPASPWNQPIAEARIVEVLALLPETGTLVDVGCGAGRLVHLMHARGWRGTGVDQAEPLIDSARKGPGTFVQGDAGDPCVLQRLLRHGVHADLAACIGATHAFAPAAEALPAATRALRAMVRPGGWLLVGQGFHRPPVPDAYLQLLGGLDGIERTHADNVQVLEAQGVQVQAAITASPAEWDAFEWAHFRRKGNRAWRDGYLRWGREVMGFGLYLAQRPAGDGLTGGAGAA